MKIAIIGSRDIVVKNMEEYISQCDEIISGGAKGVDTCAAEYARKKGIILTEILPQYELYGRAAPIIRNKEIVDRADEIIAFWNGRSRGTLSVIKYAQSQKKSCKIILLSKVNQ
ncbi:MAG: hypothetical protein IJV73_05465 [Clostridia bacterium]|nr:hypothetical protein [Clostridia bacterium]